MNKTIGVLSLLFLFYLLLPFNVNGEGIKNTVADSLRNCIDQKTGADKIAAQIDLSLEIMDTDLEEALRLAGSALQASKTSGDKNLIMRSYISLGRIYTELKNLDNSLAFLDSAKQISEELNDNWNKGEILYRIGVNMHRIGEELKALESFNTAIQVCRLSDNFKSAGSSYSIMGTIFRINGLYDRAIEYSIKAKLNYEKAGFTEGSGWSAYLLGRVYADLKLSETALGYFREALEIYTHLSEIDGNQGGVAICYEQIGLLNITLGNFEEARANFELTMKIYTALQLKDGIANTNKNLGILEYSVGNYSEAEKYLKTALEEKTELSDLLSLPGIYEYLGLSMIKTGRQKEGFSYLQKALDLAVENNQKKIQLDIYSKMTETYLDLKDLKNAVDCQKKQIEIQNLLLSGAANIKTEQLQAIYEIDQKNNQIAELEKQNRINELDIRQNRIIRNFMVLIILMALSISGIIYWLNNKLRNKNRELNETNAAKDKFFAIIAHDLRGPTSALASLLEQLNSRFDEFSKKELKDYLQILFKSAENVSNLLENLLIWSQSQVNKIEYRPDELLLDSVLHQAINGLKQTATDKEIQIRVEGNKDVVVLADPDMVQIIMRNVLSNSIKFTHRGGLVIVRSEVNSEKNVGISIIDNGIGIEKQQLEKIFDITNNFHTAGTENEKSTGLGLILVKYFVEKNSGILTIESEKNKGTTVSFTLPVKKIPQPKKQEAVLS